MPSSQCEILVIFRATLTNQAKVKQLILLHHAIFLLSGLVSDRRRRWKKKKKTIQFNALQPSLILSLSRFHSLPSLHRQYYTFKASSSLLGSSLSSLRFVHNTTTALTLQQVCRCVKVRYEHYAINSHSFTIPPIPNLNPRVPKFRHQISSYGSY